MKTTPSALKSLSMNVTTFIDLYTCLIMANLWRKRKERRKGKEIQVVACLSNHNPFPACLPQRRPASTSSGGLRCGRVGSAKRGAWIYASWCSAASSAFWRVGGAWGCAWWGCSSCSTLVSRCSIISFLPIHWAVMSRCPPPPPPPPPSRLMSCSLGWTGLIPASCKVRPPFYYSRGITLFLSFFLLFIIHL